MTYCCLFMMANGEFYIFLFLGLICTVLSHCQYKCIDEKNFKMSGLNFVCPGTKKCNVDNIYGDCNPCIYRPLCPEPRYQCNSTTPDDVTIGGVEVKCPDNYECNFFKEGDACAPCVFKKCAHIIDFVCLDDPSYVKIQDVTMKCEDGTVCNKNYLHPCAPCISESDYDYYDDFFF